MRMKKEERDWLWRIKKKDGKSDKQILSELKRDEEFNKKIMKDKKENKKDKKDKVIKVKQKFKEGIDKLRGKK